MLDFALTPQRKRRLVNLFIALFVAFQIGVPLRYYLGERGYDERFSYRMFSTLRLRDCNVRVTETTHNGEQREVNVARDIQVAWVALLERMRAAVVEKYLRRRCERPEVMRVDYVRSCQDTDHTALAPMHRSMLCAELEMRQEPAP